MSGEHVSMDRMQLLADIAKWYYLDGLSQQEISERVNLSRPSISRLLLDAKDLNVIEFTVNYPIPTASSIERELERRFSLRRAHVLEQRSPDREVDVLRTVGRLGALALNDVLEDAMILSLTWGTSVHAVIQALRPRLLPRVKVVQAIGGVGSPYRSIDGPEQCRRAAEMLGAQHYYLNAPMLVGNPETAAALRIDHSIREVLELASQPDVALVGIGATIPDISTQFHSGYITHDDLRQLDKLGAVGAKCVSFYNIAGEKISAPWIEDRAISVTWEDLQRVKTLIGIGAGIRKAPAILGALRSGLVHILVTDDLAAAEVLTLDDNT